METDTPTSKPRKRVLRRPLYSEKLISKFVHALSVDHVEVMLLALEFNGDYRAIAQKAGMPLGTVRSRLNRARTSMKGILLSEKHENGAPKYDANGVELDTDGVPLAA